MLSRTLRVSYASRLLTRRYATKSHDPTTSISTVTTPSSFWGQTFKKVTAYPFTVKPRDAQILMDAFKLLATTPLGFLFTGPRSNVLKLCSLYLRYKTRNDPIRVKAVYVPLWRQLAFIDFSAVFPDGKTAGSRTATLSELHMPGIHTPDHLAGKPLWRLPKLDHLETAPIGDCIKPFGMDAQCLPYTVSPFAPFDLAKSMNNKPIRIENTNILALPSTVVPDFYSAFPVMVPVYTGEYAWPRGDGTMEEFIFVCEAFGMEPRIANMGTDKSVKDDADGEIQVIWWRTLSNHVKKLAAMPMIKTDDDPCIRPLTQDEVDAVHRLFQVKQNLNKWLRLDTSKWPANRKKDYASELTAQRDRLIKYKPSWWPYSKLAPPSIKKTAPKPNDKSGRPARSRSSPI